MKRLFLILTAAVLLTACSSQETDDRAEELQRRYASLDGCTATVDAAVVTGEETLHYTLETAQTGEETRVTVREPEELSGVSAVVRGDALSLEFDGMVLDAGSLDPDVSAVNAVSIFLRAAAQGYVVEQGREACGDVKDALRLCFKTEHAGETLLVAAWFDAEDMPLYAEIERDGEILVYLEFTEFAFGDILPMQ